MTCWYEEKEPSGQSPARSRREYGAMVLNSSPLPIYDVHIRWARKRTRYRNLEQRWQKVLLCRVFFDVLPPADTPVFVSLFDHNGAAAPNLDYGVERVSVQMTFRDSAGRKWLRRLDGTLDEVDASVDPADAVAEEPQGWQLLEMARIERYLEAIY